MKSYNSQDILNDFKRKIQKKKKFVIFSDITKVTKIEMSSNHFILHSYTILYDETNMFSLNNNYFQSKILRLFFNHKKNQNFCARMYNALQYFYSTNYDHQQLALFFTPNKSDATFDQLKSLMFWRLLIVLIMIRLLKVIVLIDNLHCFLQYIYILQKAVQIRCY